MNVVIRSTVDPGSLENERLVLVATADVDIGEFAVFCSGVEDGSVTTRITATFWFEDLPVKESDLVVLYTKRGSSSKRVNKDGSTSHFFYWGLHEPLWGNPNYAAVVAHLDQWISSLKEAESSKRAAG